MNINYKAGHNNNYTLGRGRLLFAPFQDNLEVPGAFRFLGNAPSFSVNITSESLDHYDSTEGVQNLDESVELRVDRTGSCTLEDISPENVALFFLGSATEVTNSGGSQVTEVIPAAILQNGGFYQLGVSATNPHGVRNISETGFEVTDGAQSNPVVYNAGTAYTYDTRRGMLSIPLIAPQTGAIDLTEDLTVKYTLNTTTKFKRILSGSDHVTGSLQFQEQNATGDDYDYFMPKVEISPNGELESIGDTWKSIPLNLKILKPENGGSAIMVNGAPFA